MCSSSLHFSSSSLSRTLPAKFCDSHSTWDPGTLHGMQSAMLLCHQLPQLSSTCRGIISIVQVRGVETARTSPACMIASCERARIFISRNVVLVNHLHGPVDM